MEQVICNMIEVTVIAELKCMEEIQQDVVLLYSMQRNDREKQEIVRIQRNNKLHTEQHFK